MTVCVSLISHVQLCTRVLFVERKSNEDCHLSNLIGDRIFIQS